MSVCTFIAAGIELDEIKNPHYMMLSINEALKHGIEIEAELLESSIHKDEPDVILWSDTELILDSEKGTVYDGNLPDDFALLRMDDTTHYCDKPYGVYIECNYFTKERAERIIEYIREVLKITDSVEIWNVWLSDYDDPVIKRSQLFVEALEQSHIQQMVNYNPFDNASISGTYGNDTPIYHCLRIMA